jgi:polyphosphate kinase 2 (PPK2 family)
VDTTALDLPSGFTVDHSDDEAVLLHHGSAVDTWRENYPYDERLHRSTHDRCKRLLQIELLKLQSWIKDTG